MVRSSYTSKAASKMAEFSSSPASPASTSSTASTSTASTSRSTSTSGSDTENIVECKIRVKYEEFFVLPNTKSGTSRPTQSKCVAKCKLCHRLYKFTLSTKGNLLKHLQTAHPKNLEDHKIQRAKATTDELSTVSSDQKIMLDQPRLDVDPIKFWCQRKKSELSVVVIRLLSVPCSSAPVERLFSKAGSILSQRRSRIASTKLEKLVFIK